MVKRFADINGKTIHTEECKKITDREDLIELESKTAVESMKELGFKIANA